MLKKNWKKKQIFYAEINCKNSEEFQANDNVEEQLSHRVKEEKQLDMETTRDKK